MNNIITALIFLLIGGSTLYAQSFQQDLKDSVIYLSPQDEAFMIDKETKYLFKISSEENSLADIATNQSFSVAFERKLSKAFSLSVMANSPRSYDLWNQQNILVKTLYWRVGAELRYYYHMPGKIKQKKQANNLSGAYFGAQFVRGFYTGNEYYSTVNNNAYSISYGIQKRFLNRGFVDFYLSLGNTNFRDNLSLSAGVRAGLALGKNYQLSDDLICPIFKCHSNKKHALKINFLRRWSLQWNNVPAFVSSGDFWFLFISPNVSQEVKIANSPLSFEHDLETSLSFSSLRIQSDNFGINNYILRYHAGLRFYHGMMNRIKRGQSGNNFSGMYSFARTKLERYSYYNFGFDSETGGRFPREIIQKEVEAQVGVGYQKEVLERLYFDLGIGATRDIKLNLDRAPQGIGLVSYVKVGLMF